MLCFYSLALLLSLSLILALTLFNLFYLRDRTLQELEETANSQSGENLRELVSQGAASLGSGFTSVMGMFAQIDGILNTREEAQAPGVIQSFKYEDLPTDCLTIDERYGRKPVCFSHSSVFPLSAGSDNPMLNLTSRLDYVLPHVLSLNQELVSRLLLYFEGESGSFLRVFPGSDIPTDYNITAQPWYTDLMASGEDIRGSRPYADSLGNGETIVSHARLLRGRDGSVMGIASADTPLSLVSRSQLNISSFRTARVLIVCMDGTVMQLPGYTPINVTNLKDEDPSFWDKMMANPYALLSIEIDEGKYKVAASPMGERNNKDNWWYVLMVLVNENEVLHDIDPARSDFENASLWLLLITSGSSVITGAAVLLCILIVEQQVTKPLKGIAAFTKKLNENAASEEAALAEEMEDLQEGQSQVASLVILFKSLMRNLLDIRERPSASQFQSVSYYSYPLNHLYGGGVKWKNQLSALNRQNHSAQYQELRRS